jgi:hypothetical protein
MWKRERGEIGYRKTNWSRRNGKVKLGAAGYGGRGWL